MPKIAIQKSVVIDAPIDRVFAVVRDFEQWPIWSPWLIADPGGEVTFPEDGLSYSWEGEVTGAGGMEVLREEAPESIDYRLTFLKPWRSVADVRFAFSEKGYQTEVVWSMDGSLPLFMYFFKKMMEGFIGMDYKRGLDMLKAYVESGAVPSKLEFLGRSSLDGFNFVGVRTRCSMAEIGPSMGRELGMVRDWLSTAGLEPAGVPFSIYHKWDVVRDSADYTIGIPLKGLPPAVTKDLVSGSVPDCEVYRIKHTGPYRYLGNAWASGIMHARNKQFRQNRAVHPFEIYENDPAEVPEGDLVTVVHFPAK